ncbi:MAG TPA: glycosyltransferase family 39 protein, partial [bacterium]|nr:glycosyltransferase family 39 protein [bacterium]
YIAQQYARNLFQTGMFTFDGKTPSNGATSPLHVILLASVRQVIPDPVTSARLLGFLFHSLFLFFLFLLMRHLGFGTAVTVTSVSAAATCGFLVEDSLNGLETSLFHFLSAAFLWAAVQVPRSRNRLWIIPIAWFLCFCRPEGVLLVVAFVPVIFLTWKKERSFSRSDLLLAAALILAPLWIVFGNLLSQDIPSWRVKMLFYGESEWPLWEKLRIGFRGVASFTYFLRWYLAIPVVALILRFTACRGSECVVREPLLPQGFLMSFMAFFLLFYGAYIACLPSALAHLDFRYQHVLLPWIFPAVAWGIDSIRFGMRSPRMRQTAFALLMIALLFGSIMTYIGSRTVYADCVRSIGNVLIPLAERLERASEPGDLVAAHDVGVLGYFSNFPVLDLVGLTDPAVSRPRQTGEFDIRDWIRSKGHGYLVIHPIWDELYLHLRPDEPASGFRFLFETDRAFGDGYVVYKFE